MIKQSTNAHKGVAAWGGARRILSHLLRYKLAPTLGANLFGYPNTVGTWLIPSLLQDAGIKSKLPKNHSMSGISS